MKSSPNPYLKRIASLVGVKDPRYVLQVFVDAHRTAGDPLDVLARKLGVSRIVEHRLPFEGGLFQLPDGELVIKLNSESSFVRRRFTLAHEIGHLLLKTVPAFRSTRRTDEALERTCDLIAAELLMPTAEASEFVRGLGSPSPDKLRNIAWKYAVSIQTAALRVHHDFRLWQCSIGLWDVSSRIKTLWFTGRRKWDDVQPDLASLELALGSSSSVQTEDSWRRGEFTERVWLNLLGIGNSRVLGLVDYVN